MVGILDLFALGLGLDIAGGYLVARGLLKSDVDMATSRTWAGIGAQSTLAEASDRVDAGFGLTFLSFGFVLQAVGYLTTAAGVDAGPTGAGPAVAFIGTAAATVLVGLGVHRRFAARRVRVTALRVLQLDGSGVPRARPAGDDLMDFGIEYGDDPREGESYAEYALRVWEVPDVEDGDEVPTGGRRTLQEGRKPRRKR